jgi:hypothetical protein
MIAHILHKDRARVTGRTRLPVPAPRHRPPAPGPVRESDAVRSPAAPAYPRPISRRQSASEAMRR